jgi:hypothetical protein
LLELNGKHYEKRNSPTHVLIKLATIDNRLAIADDSIALKNILYRYRPVLFENEFLLFRSNLSSIQSIQQKDILLRNISFNESVTWPSKYSGLIWLDFKINYTIWVQIKRLLQRSPPVFITIKTLDGHEKAYRIIPAMAQEGFLLQPHIIKTEDFFSLYTDSQLWPRNQIVKSFKLTASPIVYRPIVKVRLASLPSPPSFSPQEYQNFKKILQAISKMP